MDRQVPCTQRWSPSHSSPEPRQGQCTCVGVLRPCQRRYGTQRKKHQAESRKQSQSFWDTGRGTLGVKLWRAWSKVTKAAMRRHMPVAPHVESRPEGCCRRGERSPHTGAGSVPSRLMSPVPHTLK